MDSNPRFWRSGVIPAIVLGIMLWLGGCGGSTSEVEDGRESPDQTSEQDLLPRMDAGPDGEEPDTVEVTLPAGVESVPLRFTNDLNDIHFNGRTWLAVGKRGRILVSHGSGWGPMDSGTDQELRGVWILDDGQAWACGNGGTILHLQAGVWTVVTPELEGLEAIRFNAVWGMDGHLFFAGSEGTLLHLAGEAWSLEETDTAAELTDIWGASLINIFVTTSSGAVLRNIGGPWVPDQVSQEALRSVDGVDMHQVLVVGDKGTIGRFDSLDWTLEMSNDSEYRDLFGVEAETGSLVGAGGLVVRREGGKWNVVVPDTSASRSTNLRSLARSGDALIAVGDQGAILSWNGELDWRDQVAGISDDILALAAGPEGIIAGVGSRGLILRRTEDRAWERLDSGTDETLSALVFNKSGDLLAAGDQVLVTLSARDRTASVQEIDQEALGICVNAQEQIGICGREGRLLIGDGDTWEEVETGTIQDLNDCACLDDGSVLALGALGTAVLCSREEGCSPELVPTFGTLSATEPDPSGSLLAVTEQGMVLRRESGEWTVLRTDLGEQLTDLAAANQDLLAVGWGGVLLRKTGTGDWESLTMPGAPALECVTWTGSDYLFGARAGGLWTFQP